MKYSINYNDDVKYILSTWLYIGYFKQNEEILNWLLLWWQIYFFMLTIRKLFSAAYPVTIALFIVYDILIKTLVQFIKQRAKSYRKYWRIMVDYSSRKYVDQLIIVLISTCTRVCTRVSIPTIYIQTLNLNFNVCDCKGCTYPMNLDQDIH